jgi:hypothetical protein
MRFKVPYEYGDIYYLKTDPEQLPHEIVGFIFRPGDQLILELSHGGMQIEVFDFQISKTKDPIAELGLNNTGSVSDDLD